MAAVYDNWGRLVAAVLRREELREIALRSFSDLSLPSSSSSSFDSGSCHDPFSYFSSRGLLVGESFHYHQILRATDNFNDSELIKKGQSGNLYHGVLKSGIQVVVKKFNLPSSVKQSYSISEIEVCGMVNHCRLIPVLGYCWENAAEKFLVYKYMPNKDLSRYLSGKGIIDWATRLKIATEAAEGLCYLHACSPPIVHRDIQASSILLDEDFEVCLGSLSRACIEETNNSQNRIPRFPWLPMSSEQRNSDKFNNATCAHDVYCFGKVLLVLVTGKLGMDAANEPTMSTWMENALQFIVSYDMKLVANIIDPSLAMDEHIFVELWAFAFISKACLNPKAAKRPKMSEIHKALERTNLARIYRDAAKIGSKTASSNFGLLRMRRSVKVHPRGEILSHPTFKVFTFWELKHATRDFGKECWLGQDEFGRVYRGLLHEKSMSQSGTAVAVKRMHLKRDKGFRQWQAEVEMLGRLSHPNILTPLGYCWEDNELFLIYEFIEEGSLKKYLFRNSVIQPLTWERWFKVSIGAARGLAFLHASEELGLFHHKKEGEGFYGYFKCSKILIDFDYNVKITGFGVAEVDPPSDVFEVHPLKFKSGVDGYAGPEYKARGTSLLASDVYGFGVVLVLMLTGKTTYHHTLGTTMPPLKFIEENMDPRLKEELPTAAAVAIAQLAQSCLQKDHKLRPSMEQVVQILECIGTIDRVV